VSKPKQNLPVPVRVPFDGDVVEAVRRGAGDVLILPKRICESLGLNWKSQLAVLKGARWSRVAMIAIRDKAGRAQETCVIPLKALPIWLANITPSKVRPALRAKLERYQDEAAEVLSAWFLGVSDVTGLAREFEGVKARLSALEGQIAAARQTALLYRERYNRLMRPLAPGEGEHMSLREFCDRYDVRGLMGCPMSGRALKSAGHALSQLSRLLGIEVRKAASGRGMPVAAYRIDVLQAWLAVATVGVVVPAGLYDRLLKAKLFIQ
jgi:hypothetical protein